MHLETFDGLKIQQCYIFLFITEIVEFFPLWEFFFLSYREEGWSSSSEDQRLKAEDQPFYQCTAGWCWYSQLLGKEVGFLAKGTEVDQYYYKKITDQCYTEMIGNIEQPFS